jgi:hypothetical protein
LREEAYDFILLMEYFYQTLASLAWRQESTTALGFIRPDAKGRRGKVNGQAYQRWRKACPISVSSFAFPGPAPATAQAFANLSLVPCEALERSKELGAMGVDRAPQTAAAARM